MRSFTSDLARDLRKHVPSAETADRPDELQAFLEQDIKAESGPWTTKGHEALGAIVQQISKALMGSQKDVEITVLAAEQIGKTLIALGTGLHLVVDHARNVGYFLPTKNFAHNFGRTRLQKIVNNSPFLREQMRESKVVNQATLKQFGDHYLYILGLESMLGAISIPLDALIYDEVDMLPEENLEWSQGRVAHSDLRLALFVSAGYTPGAGIDRRYQEGTQHRYLVTCPSRRCDAAPICLEEAFPQCMAKVKGKWTRVCPECGATLDLANGVWVATHPERAKLKKFSYRVSSLIIAARDADHIMNRWERRAKKKKSEKAKFNCAELAMPDAGAQQPVTDAEIERMKRRYVMKLAHGSGPRFAGMDLGDLCHFYAYDRDENGRRRIVWLEEIDSDEAVNRVSALIGNLGVTSMVVDKKPLTTVARALAFRFPRIVKLQDFTTGSTLNVVDEEHEGKKYQCVKVDRDESLDEYTSEITSETDGLVIPDPDYGTDADAERLAMWADHHKNLRKERTITEKGAVDKFKRDVANHYGMAGNSARLAELVAPKYSRFEFYSVSDGDDGFDDRDMRRRIT